MTLIFTPVHTIFNILELIFIYVLFCEDSVTDCRKDSTIQNESVSTKMKKNADEMDGQTGQIVIAAGKAKASIPQINKVLFRLMIPILMLILMMIPILMLIPMLMQMLQKPKYRDRMALEKEEWREEKLTKVSFDF